jgi:hypothetical protein
MEMGFHPNLRHALILIASPSSQGGLTPIPEFFLKYVIGYRRGSAMA